MDQELSIEELQYLFFEYERLTRDMAVGPFKVQPDRILTSASDAFAHLRYMTHEMQFSANRDYLLCSLGLVRGVLWSWGVATEEATLKRESEWLWHKQQRATNKLTGTVGTQMDSEGYANAVGRGLYPGKVPGSR